MPERRAQLDKADRCTCRVERMGNHPAFRRGVKPVGIETDQTEPRGRSGEGIGKPLEATKIFPTMVTSMVEVGEETGALPEMLTRIADTYDEEVDNAVTSITSIIEPIMIVLMALVVGTIVIALFLPLVKIIQQLSGG